MENRLQIYNFCREYVRLIDFHHCLWDIDNVEEWEGKIFEELDVLEDCLIEEIESSKKARS